MSPASCRRRPAGVLLPPGTPLQEGQIQDLAAAGSNYVGYNALAYGTVLISMIFAALIAFLVSREYMKAALVGFVAAILAFFGIIHAPQMGFAAAPALSSMWLLVGIAFLAVHFFHNQVTEPEEDTQASEPQPISGSTPAV